MTTILKPNPYSLERDMYLSDLGFFTYNPKNEEFGTNRRNPVTPVIARAALSGIDAFDNQSPELSTCGQVPGTIHVYESADDKHTVDGIRVDNPMLLEEGLKAYMDLRFKEVTPDIRGLVHRAGNDFHGFVQGLAIKGILKNTPLQKKV